MLHKKLMEIYELMMERFGPQNWWPGDTSFEVIIGAILTQNTNWNNVEKAISNLKARELLDPLKLHNLSKEELATIIKPAGYFNVKAKRIKNFTDWLFEDHDGKIENIQNMSTSMLREEILQIKGIGPETADSILLYGLNRPTFVIDTYTARITARHHLIDLGATYDDLKYLFESNLAEDIQLYNEYHALLVQVGKNFCKPNPKCENCPLNPLPHEINPEFF